MTKDNGNDKRVHLAHCYQGEYEDSCQYGDPDCHASSSANGPSSKSETKAIIRDDYALTHVFDEKMLSFLKSYKPSSIFPYDMFDSECDYNAICHHTKDLKDS
ncbi:MAG: hypothetical protein NTX25_01425 [Proteobacteria bacterium]|nr:hypothetical protein [Pseudomonadota bacterium]